jgi:5-hydroxyisourate hydrolase
MSSPITTHILDTARGLPAGDVTVTLEYRDASGAFGQVGMGVTDSDGRLRTLLSYDEFQIGIYRLSFELRGYHAARGIEGFYPEVTISFFVRDTAEHYHVPLLLSPFGYSTYRGS